MLRQKAELSFLGSINVTPILRSKTLQVRHADQPFYPVNTTLTGGIDSMLGGKFKPDWGTDGNVWDSWRRTCSPNSPARRLYFSLRNQAVSHGKNYLASVAPSRGYDFGFSPTTSSSVNYCDEPHSHVHQGHFFSDWRTIPALYPIFSPAKARGFLDIRIPSHYYYGSTKGYTYGWDDNKKVLVEVDAMEVPWEDKIDKIFWRGATTGGGNHPPGFTPQFQRHRYVPQRCIKVHMS